MELAVDRVGYRHAHSEEPFFQDFSFKLKAGEILALVGKSGAGKTTLLNLLCGYIRPEAGDIRFGGEIVDAPGGGRIPVYQDDGLWPWLRAWENVTLPMRLAAGISAARKERERAEDLLLSLGLSREAVGKYPKALSGGMKKRVELARALFAGARLLLADEPFSSLDRATRQQIYRLIIDLWRNQGLSVVLATHDLDEALLLATRIAVLPPDPPHAGFALECDNPFQGQWERDWNSARRMELLGRVLAAMENAP